MKLLILAHDFPPLISIGALRPASWYKYFGGLGAEVTVITRDWEQEQLKTKNVNSPAISTTETITGARLIKVRSTLSAKEKLITKLNADKPGILRKAITYAFSFLEFLSLKLDPTADLYYAADQLLLTEKFDFIIATGRPFILFRYGMLLSKKHNIPWVADYRDSWTQNHKQSVYSISALEHLQNSFYKLVERRYVSTASLVTTVSPTYKAFMPAYVQDRIAIVYNGYEDEMEALVADIKMPDTKFIISYAGSIYPFQKLETFLEAVQVFIRQHKVSEQEFEIRFWGVDAQAVSRIKNFDKELNSFIHIHDKVSYAEVMQKLSYSNLLLLLSADSDHWLNAKLFDYLALKRPVLMVGNETNVMAGILKDTHAGVTVGNIAAVASYIAAQYKTYKTAVPNNTVNYQQYSRKNQAAAFYQALKSVKSHQG